jgi:hypothetical protein
VTPTLFSRCEFATLSPWTSFGIGSTRAPYEAVALKLDGSDAASNL